MRVRRAATALTLLLTATALPATAAGPARAAPAPPRPLPLSALFDNRAVSDDSRPGAADFDGAGRSLSAQDLAAAGWTPGSALMLDGARLTLPRTAAGAPDNVVAHGQQVALRGRGEALTFLVSGTGGAATGTGTVRYRDGSRSSYELTAPDWRSGPLSTKAVALPHLNHATGGQSAETARLYAVAVPLRAGRAVRSVVLPTRSAAGALHVFAVSVRDTGRGRTGSWAASTAGYRAVGPWTDRTLRLVVHSGAGGPRARIRLANTFAAAPVEIAAASIAVRGAGAAAVGPPVPLTFGGGHTGTRLPAGAEAFSDPVDFTVPAGTDLLVSLHLPGTVTAAPVHQEASQLSYLSAAGSGDRTADAGGTAFPETMTSWPFLTGVDVGDGPGSVVALGDSITDGVKSTSGANRRWPDVLARRLWAQHALPRYGVLNHGISANRLVTDRYQGDGVSSDTGGVSAGHRLERDVLAQPAARTVVVFEGINDMRAGTPAEDIVAALRALARRAHERGLRVVVATVAPCAGYGDCTPAVEARRQAVNAFVRDNGGAFDATLDFDAVVRDPQQPRRLLPAYDSGDHLHPGDAGLQALGDSVDLRALAPGPGGR
ncbi:SGNH/GDSL hydrolase family protein [Streptomyces sioyaensis]|uniref:SGNH/GDSL hydrolase family protein n=1 Tax=Streptomyces sioyaensis TaxID=67364 RepID=A0A4Q1R5A2_9ACTN|nr:SGNH/GDSL hydrolase family protein [Streptomyces sioyaensis]MBM4792668.1 SGNH/GDSL hydrolase family protein [Streptomyces sioyaensis]RXS67959.1 SGNH/GDSL hydrolase family protein [Streptomyces sioyaensis]